MLDPHTYYLPDPDSPFFTPFATAFLRMMFAHAELEARIRDLQGSITRDNTFGERPENQWTARKRPKCMMKLIKEHLGDFAEADKLKDCLDRAIEPSDIRNLLAHGMWWRFNPEDETITVRAGRLRQPGEGAEHRDMTAADISSIAMVFFELENELWKFQATIKSGDTGDSASAAP